MSRKEEQLAELLAPYRYFNEESGKWTDAYVITYGVINKIVSLFKDPEVGAISEDGNYVWNGHTWVTLFPMFRGKFLKTPEDWEEYNKLKKRAGFIW